MGNNKEQNNNWPSSDLSAFLEKRKTPEGMKEIQERLESGLKEIVEIEMERGPAAQWPEFQIPLGLRGARITSIPARVPDMERVQQGMEAYVKITRRELPPEQRDRFRKPYSPRKYR